MFLDIDKREPSSIAAVEDSGQALTYGQLGEFCREWKAVIPSRTLIFILSENELGAMAAYMASLSERVVPLLLSGHTDKELLENLICLYEPQYIWFPDRQLTEKEEKRVIYKKLGYSLIRTDYPSSALFPDLALLLPTSGSTGSSKLVRHSYVNVEANARNVAAFFGLNPEERAMAVLPLHYTMGLSVVTSHLCAGATVLLSRRSLLDKEFWEYMKKYKATSFTGVPYSYELLHKLRFFRMNLPDLKIITQGGGKLSPELFKAYATYAEETGKKFIATYGQTEGTARMAYLPHTLALTKIGSIGRAIPQGELSLVDSEGQVIEEEEGEGQMVYKGPNVTLGYARTKTDLQKGDENEGVLYTGDIARRDKDGCYYIVGRMKRFLKIFGLRIGLDEIEYLVKTEFRTDCVCGGDDERLLVYMPDGNTEAVRDFIEQKTGLYHKNIEVRKIDKIERNEAGKIVFHSVDNR